MSAVIIRGKRVLVVEDEPIIAGLIADMLMTDGHEVDTVNTGRAALERLADHTYDLIVSDLRMPVLDGRGSTASSSSDARSSSGASSS